MDSIINALRSIVGDATFFQNGVVDYGGLFEYFFACLILIVSICFVFRFITNIVK